METVVMALMAMGMLVASVLMAIFYVHPDDTQSIENILRYNTWHMM